MLISDKKGVNLLIDGGEDKDILLPYLLDRGINKLEYMIISHFDLDHYGGLVDLLGKIKIKNIIISKQSEQSSEFEKFIKEACKYKINIVTVKAGDKININKDTKIDILWPNEESLKNKDLNDNSIVAKINYGEISILSTGDISKAVDNLLLDIYKNNELKADILKVAHHGSNTSSSQAFLQAVKPKIALIGVGKNNKFGHPTKEVIENLEKVGCKIYRTDEDGEVSIFVDKKGRIKVKKFIE